MNVKALAEDLGLEEHEYWELIDLFIVRGMSDLDEIQLAVVAGDTKKAAIAAHSIKGAAGNLGLMGFHDVAKEIEGNARNGCLEGAAESALALKEELLGIAAFARG